MDFRLRFPLGFDRRDRLEVQNLQARGYLSTSFDLSGRVRLTCGVPYQDLSVVNGETLTVTKAVWLRAALRYFGTPVPGSAS